MSQQITEEHFFFLQFWNIEPCLQTKKRIYCQWNIFVTANNCEITSCCILLLFLSFSPTLPPQRFSIFVILSDMQMYYHKTWNHERKGRERWGKERGFCLTLNWPSARSKSGYLSKQLSPIYRERKTAITQC